jgi:preprotein translocase subunit SecG
VWIRNNDFGFWILDLGVMSALIFLVLGVVFLWLFWNGDSKGEVMARGWGAEIRIYQRNHEPFMYWFTLALYFILTILCVALVMMLRFHS